MTVKLFWQDPYRTELETTVQSVSGNQVTLSETIFFAFSGGQESDAGTIGGVKVVGARKEGLTIFYTLEPNHGLKVGDAVTVLIDWERRYQLMRLHFAAELVLQLVSQRFPGIVKTGAHIAQDKARIDFTTTESFTPFITALQQSVQSIVDSKQPIRSAFSDESREWRYWKINDFAEVPCGGTHLKNTQEIGTVRLKRVNPGKGKERIEIYVS